jgi:hypothetical protein
MHFALLQRRLIAHIRSRVRSGELTERSAARLTGVSQPHLHNVLKGTRLLSTDMADQVLRNLRINVFDLLEPDEFRAIEERADARRGSVPLLEGRIGPGLPFPSGEGAWERFPFLSDELDRLGDPALVELAPDPRMHPLFSGGDAALLDRTPDRRRHPEPGGCYALDLGPDSLIRCVRHRPDALYLTTTTTETPEPLPGDYVSLADRNILEVVKAKVVWIGRNLEPSPFASRSPEQTG